MKDHLIRNGHIIFWSLFVYDAFLKGFFTRSHVDNGACLMLKAALKHSHVLTLLVIDKLYAFFQSEWLRVHDIGFSYISYKFMRFLVVGFGEDDLSGREGVIEVVAQRFIIIFLYLTRAFFGHYNLFDSENVEYTKLKLVDLRLRKRQTKLLHYLSSYVEALEKGLLIYTIYVNSLILFASCFPKKQDNWRTKYQNMQYKQLLKFCMTELSLSFHSCISNWDIKDFVQIHHFSSPLPIMFSLSSHIGPQAHMWLYKARIWLKKSVKERNQRSFFSDSFNPLLRAKHSKPSNFTRSTQGLSSNEEMTMRKTKKRRR
ncbi:hypothetical protein M5K25_017734 [Dendrobium thyrsiflorum]|uniref:Maturase K n=1 Tax=Dendrobium thyrsiflorum TaxID=117978 RepID=A0ABD0UNJ8_DENTH